MFLYSHCYCIYISQFVPFARLADVLAFYFHSLKTSNHFKTIDSELQISQVGSCLGHIVNFCPKCVQCRYERITRPIFYGDLVYKRGRAKGTMNLKMIVNAFDVVSMTQCSRKGRYMANACPFYSLVQIFT